MKCLILANNSVGLFKFRGLLIKELCKKGQVIASVPIDKNVEDLKNIGCELKDISIDRRGINVFKDFILFLKYIRLIKREKPDFVITYTIKPNVYGGLACRLFHIPFFANITGLGTTFQNENILKKIVVLLYKISVSKSKTIFFENVENQSVFINEEIITQDRTCLLNGAGVDLNHFQYQDYPKDDSVVNFLFVGRVMKEKGMDELFYALKKLNDTGHNCVLSVLGSFEDDYKNIIESYSQEGWLKYYGFQDDIRPFIKQSHCFVLPSWHEGMANTNLECAASGRPVITSNIHGCLEAVVENKSGYLAEIKNADSLYECLKKFIELPYERKVEMGKQSRIHMEEVFDKRLVVDKTIERLFD